MSTKKEMIILEPDGRIRKEGFCSRPMTCPYCGGKGWFHSGQREPETITCPDCQGTGEVIAFVTIDWRPNVKKNNMSETKFKCCICGKEVTGHTYNANPVWDGECCQEYNWKVVIPERIRMSNLNNKK